jgi:hypothetical protein
MAVIESGNDFSGNGLTATAQQLADRLKSDAYIDSLKASRARLGVDIAQLKADMAAIRAGILVG